MFYRIWYCHTFLLNNVDFLLNKFLLNDEGFNDNLRMYSEDTGHNQ